MSNIPTLFNDTAAIYDEYDRTFGIPENAAHDGHTCRECDNRQRWQADHANTIQQYCGVRRSNRTRNGLLKIKCNQAACCLFQAEEKTKENE